MLAIWLTQYLPMSAYIVGRLTTPVLPKRFTLRQFLLCVCSVGTHRRKATLCQAAECSSHQCGHRWTDIHTSRCIDAYGDSGVPCESFRISDSAARYTLQKPSVLWNGSPAPCRKGTVPVDRTTNSLGHSFVSLRGRDSMLRNSRPSNPQAQTAYPCHISRRVS